MSETVGPSGGAGSEAAAAAAAAPPPLYPPSTVFLNVYDILDANAFLAAMGCGVHHAGVEVYGVEVQYGRCREGSSGVTINTTPRHMMPHTFREQFALGTAEMSSEGVHALVKELIKDPVWDGGRYHFLEHNCLHFVQHLLGRLLPVDTRLRAAVDVRFFQGGAMECVVASGGECVSVPSLVPSHVNRLANWASTYAPRWVIDKLETMDRA